MNNLKCIIDKLIIFSFKYMKYIVVYQSVSVLQRDIR